MSAVCLPTNTFETNWDSDPYEPCISVRSFEWRSKAETVEIGAAFLDSARTWGQVFNTVRLSLFGACYRDLSRFVTVVSSISQVSQVVLFEDEEQTHVWTAMDERNFDLETLILDAAIELEDRWQGRDT